MNEPRDTLPQPSAFADTEAPTERRARTILPPSPLQASAGLEHGGGGGDGGNRRNGTGDLLQRVTALEHQLAEERRAREFVEEKANTAIRELNGGGRDLGLRGDVRAIADQMRALDTDLGKQRIELGEQIECVRALAETAGKKADAVADTAASTRWWVRGAVLVLAVIAFCVARAEYRTTQAEQRDRAQAEHSR